MPLRKTTEHEVVLHMTENNQVVEKVHKFSMNPLSEIVKLLARNPETTDKISALPDHIKVK